MAKKILAVDDNRVIQQLLVVNLELEGYEVVTASDGEEAISQIHSEKPDLVLLDVMMPKLDGWEVARRVKADPKIARTPIIFLSARAQDLDVRRGLELGVHAYMTKPFDPVDLMDVVQRVLRGERIIAADS
ncbi:MAG: response regulator transcription factor [Actinomycetota bacterium]